MKILMIHEKYNWDSYSIVRSACDVLKEREDVEYIEVGSNKMDEMGEGDYAWVFSSNFNLMNIEYQALKAQKIKIVTFGLSDPNMFEPERLKTCDIYCTNDYRSYIEYAFPTNCFIYYFPFGVDLKRFRMIDIGKDIDVLFIGTLNHGYIPMRKQYIPKLKKEFNFEGYGKGFERFLNGEELVSAFNRSHLNVDICTKVSSLASRIFQAAACGVPTLTLKREDVLQCFENGGEILTYEGGYNELKYAIIEALRDKNKLAEIGENARQRCLKEHGMRKRIDDLLKYLGEINEKH